MKVGGFADERLSDLVGGLLGGFGLHYGNSLFGVGTTRWLVVPTWQCCRSMREDCLMEYLLTDFARVSQV